MPYATVTQELAAALEADRPAIRAGLAFASPDLRALTERVLEAPSLADPRVQGRARRL